MFTNLRKKFQKRSLLYLIYGPIILLMIMSAGHDLFHNHEPDLFRHHDCPAFHLYLLLTTMILFIWIFFTVFALYAIIFISEYKFVCCLTNDIYFSRAPPLQNF